MSIQSDLDIVDILLVDDRASNLLALRSVLQRPDYNLVLARSGEEALARVLRQEFAVILLDVAMPGMDGFQVASLIKERDESKHVPIIFITARVYEIEHIFHGYAVGAVDYIPKPVDAHAVRSKVAVFVELFRQRKEIERQAARLREIEVEEQLSLRRRAEAALEESESIHAVTFEEAPVGIGHSTPEGVLTRANRHLSQLLGHEPESLLGRRLEEFAADEDEAALVTNLRKARRSERCYSGEHRLRSATSDVVWVQITLSPLHVHGLLSRFILVLNDITGQKRAEIEHARLLTELARGIRERDDFLSVAAHELRTPVAPIRLQLSSLLREADKEHAIPIGRLTRRLRTIERSTLRLEQLIERLVDISNLNVRAFTLDLADVDLAKLTQSVVDRYRREEKGASIAVVSDAPVVGRWDRQRLEQVIENLLSNALKYGEGKPVEINVSASNAHAMLGVQDHGLGIPVEDQERMFDRFEQVDTPRRASGFGLGLWLAREVIEAHGGHISVCSEPGRGSRFQVELPLSPSQDAAPRLRLVKEGAHP